MVKHLKGDYVVYSVAIKIINFVPLLRSFIANVLKCKGHLKIKFKCVSVAMCSLVMGLFSGDFIKTEID